jgi:Sulfate permease and related transporters (MFS superfamily)
MKIAHTPLEIPSTGIEGFKKNWKADFISGFLVFLIALPLCLGIAMASKFPPIAGIMTAVVGGLIVTFMQGSFVTIKGPAAGLIVIVFGAVEELGGGNDMLGYKLTLAVIVVAGVLQAILGLLRTGSLGDYFPSSAIHGLLAAIGVIIVAKQMHTVLGVIPEGKEPLHLIAEIPNSIMHLNPEIAFIGLLSLAILFLLPLIKNKYIKMIPAQMVVILVAIPLGHYFLLEQSHHYMFLNTDFDVGPSYLVKLPTEISEMLNFPFPDFSAVFSAASIKWIILFALIGSLESLLSTKAIDILDHYKRKSDLNKDMLAVGIGNVICGFIGALPMISEIVRSSANVNNGGRTKWSNFFHGMFLLLFVMLLPDLLKSIPLAALGAMLIFTGYRLASPKVFKEIAKIGKDQLLIFISTLIVTLATDLIIGIVFGIIVNYIIHFLSGATFKTIYNLNIQHVVGVDGAQTIVVSDTLTFANYLKFKKELNKIPQGNTIVLDFGSAKMVDHTVLEHLYHYAEDYHRGGGNIKIQGLENLTARSAHPLAARVRTNKFSKIRAISREMSLKNIASEMNWLYTSTSDDFNDEITLFSEQDKSVSFVGSTLTKEINNITINVFDISLAGGGTMKTQIQNVTVLSIEKQVPSFVLTEESMFEKLFNNTLLDDIDFEEFPKFSAMYKLVGSDLPAIRNFFNPALIGYLEMNYIYNIESTGNQILIFKKEKVAYSEEIMELAEFGKGLLCHI